MRIKRLLPALVFLPLVAVADLSAFSTGPVFDDFGPVADAEATIAIPEGARFRHSFDVSQQAEEGEQFIVGMLEANDCSFEKILP